MDIAGMINEELAANVPVTTEPPSVGAGLDPPADEADRAILHLATDLEAAGARAMAGEPPTPPAEPNGVTAPNPNVVEHTPVAVCAHCGKRVAFATCYRNGRGQLFCNRAEYKAYQHGSAGTVAKGALPQANRHNRRRLAKGSKR